MSTSKSSTLVFLQNKIGARGQKSELARLSTWRQSKSVARDTVRRSISGLAALLRTNCSHVANTLATSRVMITTRSWNRLKNTLLNSTSQTHSLHWPRISSSICAAIHPQIVTTPLRPSNIPGSPATKKTRSRSTNIYSWPCTSQNANCEKRCASLFSTRSSKWRQSSSLLIRQSRVKARLTLRPPYWLPNRNHLAIRARCPCTDLWSVAGPAEESAETTSSSSRWLSRRWQRHKSFGGTITTVFWSQTRLQVTKSSCCVNQTSESNRLIQHRQTL